MDGRPNRLWLADITYIPTREDFLYLAFILDAHSRKVVGWSIMVAWRRAAEASEHIAATTVA